MVMLVPTKSKHLIYPNISVTQTTKADVLYTIVGSQEMPGHLFELSVETYKNSTGHT